MLAFHTSRKSTRTYDTNSSASQKTKWRTSIRIDWYGYVSDWHWLTRNETVKQLFDVTRDSGASMHVISRKDLNSAELDFVKVLKNWTTVITTNDEVPTKEETTEHTNELDSFVIVMVLEDTSTVRSLEKKLYEDHDYNCYWFSGQKTQLITNDRKKEYDTTNHVQVVVPRLSTSSSSSSSPTSPSSSSQDVVTPTQHPASIRRESMSDEVRGDSSRDSTKIENPNTNDNEEVRDDTLRDLCEWLEEFKKNLVNSIQELRYASSSSHDLPSESLEKWYRNLHLLPEGSKLR